MEGSSLGMFKLLDLIFIFYFIYCHEEMLFYLTEKFYCKKYKGKCEECECWSCKRKVYLEEGE